MSGHRAHAWIAQVADQFAQGQRRQLVLHVGHQQDLAARGGRERPGYRAQGGHGRDHQIRRSGAGGSYVIVQKYLHDLKKWNAIPVEVQEGIVGRKKFTNVELDDSVKPSFAHNALTTIVENGKELDIVRDNMPFGDVAKGEFGTYFIGYARSPARIEQMLVNMFVGRPPGNYDRLLDVSQAITGSLFFVPSATFLENVDPKTAPPTAEPATAGKPDEAKSAVRNENSDDSLGIGSLKKEV